jgi:LmbE family N-acetylglucosaminyl deacetylase
MSEQHKPSVVFFGAHPDDVELFALGTLLKLKALGWRIGWVIATDGSAGNGDPDPALARTRKQEAQAAADLCGAEMVWLGFPDGELVSSDGAQAAVSQALRKLKPDLCITHHLNDYHCDHRAVSRFVTEACQLGAQLLYAEPMLGIGPQPDLIIDITDTFENKCAALEHHRSQSPAIMIRALDVWNGFRGIQLLTPGVRKAEGFMVSGRTLSQPDPMQILPEGLTIRRFQAHV